MAAESSSSVALRNWRLLLDAAYKDVAAVDDRSTQLASVLPETEREGISAVPQALAQRSNIPDYIAAARELEREHPRASQLSESEIR